MKITKTQLKEIIRQVVSNQIQEQWSDQPTGYGRTNEEKLVKKAIELTGGYGSPEMQEKAALQLLEKAVAYLRRRL